MFGRTLFPEMRDLEEFLFGSPESAEHVFDLDESFHSVPTRRRTANTSQEPKPQQGDVWYFIVDDPQADQVTYEVPMYTTR